MNTKIFIFFLATYSCFLLSCEKNKITYGDFETGDPGSAYLKINYASSFARQDTVQFKLNNARLTGLIAYRTPYPGGGYNTGGLSVAEYMQVQPGNHTFSLSIPKKGSSEDSVVRMTNSLVLESGKSYTLHIADTGTNIKHVLTNDNVAIPDTGLSRYKFINLMPNVPAVDLYYGTTLVAENIKYLSQSDYFQMKVPPPTSLTWAIRHADSSATSTALATYSSTNTTQRQRVYTVFALGYRGSTSTTLKPYVSFFLVK